jgi:hypothetical protein
MLNKLTEYLNKKNEGLILSYRALRRLIGVFGILLPFINILGGLVLTNIPVQETISDYYYTNMRDFLTGLLFVVSLFLITYKGYNLIDFVITAITGLFGLGMAIFPCYNEMNNVQRVGIFQLMPKTSDHFHLFCAALFFILLAVNSLFLFTRTNVKMVTPEKKIRNLLYRICGILILACVLVIFFCNLYLTREQLYNVKIILILETIALCAFGVSWLIKGRTLFADKNIRR